MFDSDKFTSVRNSLIQVFGKKWYYCLIALFAIAVGALLHELIALVIRMIEKSKKKKEPEPAPVPAENNA